MIRALPLASAILLTPLVGCDSGGVNDDGGFDDLDRRSPDASVDLGAGVGATGSPMGGGTR